MPWTNSVKKTIFEIFDHLDTDKDEIITVNDMLHAMSNVTEAGIRDAFRSLDKQGGGRISRIEFKRAWRARCQDPRHPNNNDLVALRGQFGLLELPGAPSEEVSQMYLDMAMKKRVVSKKREAVLNSNQGWTAQIVDALSDLHARLAKTNWKDLSSKMKLSQLVYPEPFEECSLAAGLLCLPDWLASFKNHYVDHGLSLDKILLLSEQLSLIGPFSSSPRGSLANRSESPLFLPTREDAAQGLELTLERVTAAQHEQAANQTDLSPTKDMDSQSGARLRSTSNQDRA